ncbi:hypothetical protein N0V83_000736 [Neocucurbitaria cava]|uniref:Uncharacterized protein n=1 Tax=Neocucurbitaria cava TaxID=798079 RepID=A0A9W8YIE3_9PLEO|nr:hypothetical protein N0V83_000736 [Neocucurbitaria cava]
MKEVCKIWLLQENATQRALGTTELLENVLINMNILDVTQNAQAVSRSWNHCIHGSIKIRKRCFLYAEVLSAENTNNRLFFEMYFPDFSRYLAAQYIDVPEFRQYLEQNYADLLDLEHISGKIAPVMFRKTLVSDPRMYFYTYGAVMCNYFVEMEQWDNEQYSIALAKLRENGGTNALESAHSLLDKSCLVPYLQRFWKEKQRAIWTGHGRHVIFWLGGHWPNAGHVFKHIRCFLSGIIDSLSTNRDHTIWQTVQITLPACTELTVGIVLPGILDDGEVLETVRQDTGITLYEFAKLFVKAVRGAFARYSQENIILSLTEIHQYELEGAIVKAWEERYTRERELLDKSRVTVGNILRV